MSLLARLSFACLAAGSVLMGIPAVAAECASRGGDAWPRSAHYVPPDQAFTLQQQLDEFRAIRLQPAGDYRHAPSLILRTGEQVYGMAGSRLPRIVVQAGAHDAVLSGVAPLGLAFQPSDLPTYGNCFERIWTAEATDPVSIIDAVAVDNLFLDIGPGSVRIDTRRQGYIRNNRFIRLEMHAVSPSLTVLGNRSRPSSGNVFLWTNILTPPGDGIVVAGQEEINFVGLDAESWNWNRQAVYPSMLNVSDTNSLRLFMPQGGDPHGHNGQIMTADATSVQLFGLRFSQAGDPALTWGPRTATVTMALSQTRSTRDLAQRGVRLNLYPDFSPGLSLNGEIRASGSLPMQDVAAIARTFASAHGQAWQVPLLPSTLPQAQMGAASAGRDDTDSIQRQIDTQGIAMLEAGTYYVSRPLRLKSGQGILGAGAGLTSIVALDPAVDIVVGSDHFETIHGTSFVLADLSLIGGRTGLRTDALGSGKGAQYTAVTLTHVNFLHMKRAGILIDTIYGWDNNLIDNVSFIDCDIGIEQVVPSWYVKDDMAGMTYLDKNLFYRTQFIGGRVALSWHAKRPNGLDVFVDSTFRGWTQGVLDAENTESPIFANVDFVANGGNPMLADNLPVGCVGCRIDFGSPGGSVFDNLAMCEGCELRGASAQVRVTRPGAHALLFNSNVTGQFARDGFDGLLVNSRASPWNSSQLITKMESGSTAIIANGAAIPVLQLLSQDAALP